MTIATQSLIQSPVLRIVAGCAAENRSRLKHSPYIDSIFLHNSRTIVESTSSVLEINLKTNSILLDIYLHSSRYFSVSANDISSQLIGERRRVIKVQNYAINLQKFSQSFQKDVTDGPSALALHQSNH